MGDDLEKYEVPVFDRRNLTTLILNQADEWTPRRSTIKLRGGPVLLPNDGPTLAERQARNAAWQTSQHFSGQAANDNNDWPLQKLLRAEGHCEQLRTAERYRRVWDAANDNVQLVGRDPGDDIYLMANTDLDASTGRLKSSGVKVVTGRMARHENPPSKSTPADEQTKKRAAPIPKKWNGDMALVDHIDAKRELAAAQIALGYLVSPLESAVCDGDTLEAIGRAHGVGSEKGAKAAGRVLVFLGLDAIAAHFGRHDRMARAA